MFKNTQKKVIRIICKKERNYHISGLFLQLKLLKFEHIVNLKCALSMNKVTNSQLPISLAKHFSRAGDKSCQVHRNKDEFCIKYVRTTQRSLCLSYYGVKLFNSLPKALTSQETVYFFKKK